MQLSRNKNPTCYKKVPYRHQRRFLDQYWHPLGSPNPQKHQKHYGFSPFSLYHFFAPSTSPGATFSTFWCHFASKWLPQWPLGSHFGLVFRPEWPPGNHLWSTWGPLGDPATKKSRKWCPRVPTTTHFGASSHDKSNPKSIKKAIKINIIQLRKSNYNNFASWYNITLITQTPYWPGEMRVAFRIKK